MKTKAQEWFLIKKNWMEWIQDLTMEQRGELLTALFTRQVPEGLLGILVKSHMDEFDRVNDSREEGLAKRREASKKGNEIKYQSTPSGNNEETDSTPTLSRTNTNTNTNTNTDIDTEISKRDIEIDKNDYLNYIVDNTDISEEELYSIPEDNLSVELKIRKSNLYFQ